MEKLNLTIHILYLNILNVINKEQLLNIAYKYYPKNLVCFSDRLELTEEFKQLRNKSEKLINEEKENWELFILDLKKKFNNDNISIRDKTSYFVGQPSFSVQISNYENDIHYSIYRSFLIDFYYIVKNDKNGLEYNPERLFEQKCNELCLMLNCQIFPEELLFIKLPDVSFENISSGNFNLQNAFFNKKNIIL